MQVFYTTFVNIDVQISIINMGRKWTQEKLTHHANVLLDMGTISNASVNVSLAYLSLSFFFIF